MKLTDQATRKGFLMTILAAWTALLLGMGGCSLDLLRKPPQVIDVQEEIGEYTSASFFAKNFITLFLTGAKNATRDDTKSLAAMTVMSEPPKLPSDPYTVLDVNLIKPRRVWAGSNTEWIMTAGVTLIPPGAGAPQRNYFLINLIESKDGTFRAMSWPRLVNYSTPPFDVSTLYTQGVALNGPLGTTVHNFSSAFYQSGNEGQLGRFVSQEFTDKPIVKSPFTSVEVQSISSSQNSPNPADAKPGDKVQIMASLKGSTAADTWNVFQVAMTLVLGDNNQWLVDKLDDAIDFGEVSQK